MSILRHHSSRFMNVITGLILLVQQQGMQDRFSSKVCRIISDQLQKIMRGMNGTEQTTRQRTVLCQL